MYENFAKVLAIIFNLSSLAYASPLQSDIWQSQSLASGPLSKRLDEAATEFTTQFRNPAEIIAVLLIIGGSIVQKAIAQLSGSFITPVSFSFGWVAYAFESLLSAFGDGVFLPQPDIPAKIITVQSRGSKINESWIIGRLIRDLELDVEKDYESEPWRLETSLMISVYDALPDVNEDKEVEKNQSLPPRRMKKDWIWYSYFGVCAAQLGIAAVPLYRQDDHERNWAVLLITASGILLALFTGSSREFKREKFACRRDSSSDYLLTRGNGHKHVFLIRHREARNIRWPRAEEKEFLGVSLNLEDLANVEARADWRSRAYAVVNALLWIIYLVSVGGQDLDSWYLFAVGAIGMAHNVLTASIKRHPDAHGFHMRRAHQTVQQNSVFGQPATKNSPRPKVMKGLIQVEKAYPGVGIALLAEFFPGGLREGQDTAVDEVGIPQGPNRSEKEQWDLLKESLSQRRLAPRQLRGQNRAVPNARNDGEDELQLQPERNPEPERQPEPGRNPMPTNEANGLQLELERNPQPNVEPNFMWTFIVATLVAAFVAQEMAQETLPIPEED